MFAPLIHGQNRNSRFDPSDIVDGNNQRMFWIDHNPNNATENPVNYVDVYHHVKLPLVDYDVYDILSYYENPRMMGTVTQFGGNYAGDFFTYDFNSNKYIGIDTNSRVSSIIEEQLPLKNNLTSFFVIGLSWLANPSEFDAPLSIQQTSLSANTGYDNLSTCVEVYREYIGGSEFEYFTKFQVVLSNIDTSTSNVIGFYETSLGIFNEDELPSSTDISNVFVISFDIYRMYVNGVLIMDWSTSITAAMAANAPYTIFRDENPPNYVGLMGYNNMCYVGEILMYGKSLTDSERRSVTQWLMDKYQL